MSDPAGALVSAAARDALQAWLEALKALRSAPETTLSAYRTDVLRFLAFLAQHHGGMQGLGPLTRVSHQDMRAWMAQERGRGTGPRSLARRLSAVKSFYRFLAARDGIDPSVVLSVRAPRHPRKLPRPLSEDAAAAMLDRVGAQHPRPWIAARDIAVVTLLYGCGLRISEALSLSGAALPLGESLRITGKGGKERIVPLIPAARAATEAYLALCPW
ncbi:MAG: site-specific integrase, partial [Paracoccaceae bacterium]